MVVRIGLLVVAIGSVANKIIVQGAQQQPWSGKENARGTVHDKDLAGGLGAKCRLICSHEVRTHLLAKESYCNYTIDKSTTPELFHACVEGRKIAFGLSCNPLCLKTGMPLSSIQGCSGTSIDSMCRKVTLLFFNMLLPTLLSLIFPRITRDMSRCWKPSNLLLAMIYGTKKP